jgi:UDP-N-acetylglucosamine--N-acetylmuramyl-(pentapeptide) pyrophosphoryl-undecaprenol N-acetylglucosamine transferase
MPDLRLVFFGTDRPIDGNILGSYDFEWIRQPVRPLPRRPWRVPGFLLGWQASARACRRFFDKHRPIAVLGSGGYASAPSICEASRAGIPTALLNPDALPGKANRWLGSRVRAIFAQWPETVEHFNGQTKVQVTGCPVRPEFKCARQREGIEHFGLDPAKSVLLITGASQGAQSVNRAVLAALPEFARRGVWQRWQLLHVTGPKNQAEVTAAYRGQGVMARVVGYSRHMAAALAAADLVLSRAGASTLAEISALGRPSVLMPYPHHRDQHQVANARVLVKLGASRMVLDRVDPQTNAPLLADTLARLMNDPTELARLEAAARRIGTTNAASAIAQELLVLAEKSPGSAPPESMEKPCRARR